MENYPEIKNLLKRESDKGIVKEAFNEAVKEWLDDKFKAFGKWTLFGIAAATFAYVVKTIVQHGHWP